MSKHPTKCRFSINRGCESVVKLGEITVFFAVWVPVRKYHIPFCETRKPTRKVANIHSYSLKSLV